ncbi:LuxR family transcriptional regulator [Cellulomonas sp. WB94]|uniref:ATP-binding protein n=1 Tax=Cellulomonas sp. WB94 TaxID=2173174 RepID=UPI0013049D61|nr:LuxR family transcriptional regulator [Cellulomonas sp. WB94]
MTQPAFVGRGTEFGVMERVWQDVSAGVRRVVFLGAEAGGGKSRFVVESALALHGEGAGVLWGGCVAEMGMAYDPFVEPLGTLLGAVYPDGDGPGPDPLAVQRLGALTGTRVAQPADGIRIEDLCRAVADILQWATTVRPVVLVLEDLHWAGPAALEVLKYVVRRCVDLPLLVLATLRSPGPSVSTELSAVISNLFAADGVLRLDLAGLDVADITTYLVRNSIVGSVHARQAAAAMRDSTGGNPFLLREVCRQLDKEALLAGRPAPISAPGAFAALVAERIGALPGHGRDVIRLAAVMGEEVDVGELSAAMERLVGERVSRAETVAALELAKVAGLLDATALEDAAARFPHALARQAVIETLSDLEQAQSHAAVALTLEDRPSARRRTIRLAAHYAGAAVLGFEAQASTYLAEAGDLTNAASAHAEAADYYERAARFAQGTRTRDELRLSAARSALLGWQCQRARSLDEVVAGSPDPELRLRAAIGYSSASWHDGQEVATARRLLADALLAPDDSPADLRVVATVCLARAHAWSGDAATGRLLGSSAIARAHELGDPEVLARVLSISLNDGSSFEQIDQTLERTRELMTLAQGTTMQVRLGRAHYHRCASHYVKGEPSELTAAARDLEWVADRARQPFWRWVSDAVAFGLALAHAELDRAETVLAQAIRDSEVVGHAVSGTDGLMTFALRRESGLPVGAAGLLPRPGDVGVWPPAALALAAEVRDAETCRGWLQHVMSGDLGHLQASASWPAALGYLVDAAVWLGDAAVAERLVPLVARYEGFNLLGSEFLHPLGSADLPLAMLESLLGRPEARAHFESALAMNERMGATLHIAHTLVAYARHLSTHPAPDVNAEALSARARVLAEDHGLVRVRRDLDELADRRRTPWGLTAREDEVLGLLRLGLSNRGIARTLVISEHTAANHVRNILMKTHSSNRTQAAMLRPPELCR